MIKRIKNNPFAWNSLVLFSGSMAANVLNYFFHLIIGRIVSVEIYGEVQSLTSLMNIISVPAMTLTMVAMKYAAGTKAENNPRGSYEIMKFLGQKVLKYGLPIFIAAVLLTPFVRDFLNIKSNMPIILVWAMMFLSFFGSINNGILQGWQKFLSLSWAGVWGAILKLVIGVILVKIGFGLNGVIGSFAASAFISYFISVYLLRFIITQKDGQSAVEKISFDSIKKYVIPVFVGSLAINILGNADMVIAKHNLDAVAAGQYGALTIVSKIIFFATGVIATVLFSMAAENSHKKNSSVAMLLNSLYLTLFVSICGVIAYFAFPELILSLLFGSKYVAVAGYLGWFAIVVSLFSVFNLIFQYLLSVHIIKPVYIFLGISILSSLAMLLVGKDIFAIISIVAVSQILAIAAGVFFLFNKKNEF